MNNAEERPELAPVVFMLLEALKQNDLLNRDDVELSGMGYVISWRKIDE